jgi:hypothetical protein
MKTKKHRNTLAKQIETAPTVREAYELACHGRKRTELEIALAHFAHCIKEFRKCDSPDIEKSIHFEVSRSIAPNPEKFTRDDFRKLLGDYVERSAEDLLALAEDYPESNQDTNKQDALILTFKETLDRAKRKMSIRTLAKWLGQENSADGNSALRRRAKRLKFPLAKERSRKRRLKTCKASKS